MDPKLIFRIIVFANLLLISITCLSKGNSSSPKGHCVIEGSTTGNDEDFRLAGSGFITAIGLDNLDAGVRGDNLDFKNKQYIVSATHVSYDERKLDTEKYNLDSLDRSLLKLRAKCEGLDFYIPIKRDVVASKTISPTTSNGKFRKNNECDEGFRNTFFTTGCDTSFFSLDTRAC